MSKRSTSSGDSPTPKSQRLVSSSPTFSTNSSESVNEKEQPLDISLTFLEDCSEDDSNEPELPFEPLSSPESTKMQFESCSTPPINPVTGSQDLSISHGDEGSPHSFPPDFAILNISAETLKDSSERSSQQVPSQHSVGQDSFTFESQPDCNSADNLAEIITSNGIEETAKTIMSNECLKREILRLILLESHHSLKNALKNSQLSADKKERTYLLSLTPRTLCEEFKANSSSAFLLLVKGLLGIADPEIIFDSQYLLNNICSLYSCMSKVINRKATGYALLMTSAARDGGLREDSIKLFSMLVHPRTSQKYDKEVMCKDWDKPLSDALSAEKEHFEKLHRALQKKADLIIEGASDDEIGQVKVEIKQLHDSVPPQVQQVWDNLNLRTKHRQVLFRSLPSFWLKSQIVQVSRVNLYLKGVSSPEMLLT